MLAVQSVFALPVQAVQDQALPPVSDFSLEKSKQPTGRVCVREYVGSRVGNER